MLGGLSDEALWLSLANCLPSASLVCVSVVYYALMIIAHASLLCSAPVGRCGCTAAAWCLLQQCWVKGASVGCNIYVMKMHILQNILFPFDVGPLWLRHGICFWGRSGYCWRTCLEMGWARVLSLLVEDGWSSVKIKQKGFDGLCHRAHCAHR